MANVLFTTYCNRQCAYCFAKDKLDLEREQADSQKNLSMAGLEEIIAFYKRSQLRRFVVIGGEPTLHPDFNRMIDRILEEPEFKAVIIFSNGLMPQSVRDHLAGISDPRVRIALNLNPPEDHRDGQWDHVNSVMKALGKRVGLGINVHKPGQPYDYLIDAVKAYGLEGHIRVGLTHPVVGENNIYAREEDFPAIADDLLSFAEKIYRENLSFSFDCGFQFCMFSLDQHRELLRMGIRFSSVCSPIIDIGPDLKIWRCFPFSNDVCGRLSDFPVRNKLTDHYDAKYRTLLQMGNRKECPECRHRINGLCNGGCLSRTLNAFHGQTDNKHPEC